MTEQLDNNKLNKVKLLWKKFGLKLLTLISIILILIIAWLCSHKRKLADSIQASKLYENLALIADNASSNSKTILNQAQNIMTLYLQGIYGDFVHFEYAKQSVLKNQLNKVTTSLKRIFDSSVSQNLQVILKLCLIRVKLA